MSFTNEYTINKSTNRLYFALIIIPFLYLLLMGLLFGIRAGAQENTQSASLQNISQTTQTEQSPQLQNPFTQQSPQQQSPQSQTQEEESSSESQNNLSLVEFVGELTRKNGNSITVRIGDESREFTLLENTSVTRNTEDSSLEELTVGDKLTIQTDNNNRVASINAVSQQVFDISVWTLIALLAIIIIALILFLINRANRGHIRTQTTQVNR